MTVTWSAIRSDEAVLVGVIWKKEPGSYNVTVPAGAKFVRAHAQACGGQGDHWGGSGAYARSRRPVTPSDNLVVQVGTVNTSLPAGDSFVKTNAGDVICYADRGRGSGNAGLAANSIGDVTRDGAPGAPPVGGAPPSDAADPECRGFGGVGADVAADRTADYGGGGLVTTDNDENGIGIIVGAFGAGTGLVCLEFFDSDPGY